MPTVPTYESRVTLNPTPLQESRYVDASKMFPNTAPDFTKVSAAMMAYQKQIDKTRVLEAKNNALEYVYQATYGDDGYLKVQGEKATLPDENGQGLAQRATSGFDEFVNNMKAEKKYTSSQLRDIDQALSAIRLNFQSSVSSHVLGEQKKFGQTQLKNGMLLAERMARSGYNNAEAISKAADTVDSTVQTAYEAGLISKLEALNLKEGGRSSVWAAAIMGNLAKMGETPKQSYEFAKALYKAHSKELTDETAIEIQGKIIQAGQLAARNEITNWVQNLVSKGMSTGMSTASAVLTNGKMDGTQCVSEGVLFGGLKYNGQLDTSGNPIIRGKNGYGVSGLPVEVARSVFNSNPKKFSQLGATFDEEKYKYDEQYNLRIGMEYFSQCFRKHPDSIEEAVAAYRYGEDALQDAKDKAKEKGNNWLDNLSAEHGGKSALLKVVQEAKNKQYGVVLDSAGNTVNPLSADYMNFFVPTLGRDKLDALVQSVAGDLVANNALMKEELIQHANASVTIQANAIKANYTNSINKCMQAIETNGAKLGADCLPQEEIQKLPIASQQALVNLATRKGKGYVDTDWDKIYEAQANNGAAMTCSQEEYETFWRPFFGKQVETMDKFRASVLQSGKDRQAQIAHFQMCKNKGIILDGFQIMDNEKIVGIWANATSKKLDPTNSSDFQKIIAIRTYLGSLAQQESKVDSKGNPKPFDENEATIRIQKALRSKIKDTGIVPDFMLVSELTDRGRSDAFALLKNLTQMWGESNPAWRNYTVSPQDMQEVLTLLTMGDPIQIKGFNDSSIVFTEEGKKPEEGKLYVDKAVWQEATKDVMKTADVKGFERSTYYQTTGETTVRKPNPAYVLGRYFQILKEGRQIEGNRVDDITIGTNKYMQTVNDNNER